MGKTIWHLPRGQSAVVEDHSNAGMGILEILAGMTPGRKVIACGPRPPGTRWNPLSPRSLPLMFGQARPVLEALSSAIVPVDDEIGFEGPRALMILLAWMYWLDRRTVGDIPSLPGLADRVALLHERLRAGAFFGLELHTFADLPPERFNDGAGFFLDIISDWEYEKARASVHALDSALEAFRMNGELQANMRGPEDQVQAVLAGSGGCAIATVPAAHNKRLQRTLDDMAMAVCAARCVDVSDGGPACTMFGPSPRDGLVEPVLKAIHSSRRSGAGWMMGLDPEVSPPATAERLVSAAGLHVREQESGWLYRFEAGDTPEFQGQGPV